MVPVVSTPTYIMIYAGMFNMKGMFFFLTRLGLDISVNDLCGFSTNHLWTYTNVFLNYSNYLLIHQSALIVCHILKIMIHILLIKTISHNGLVLREPLQEAQFSWETPGKRPSNAGCLGSPGCFSVLIGDFQREKTSGIEGTCLFDDFSEVL